MDGGTRREPPMATTTQFPTGTANASAATAAPPTGLPAEQLYTWLEWVQDDLRRLEARLDYLESHAFTTARAGAPPERAAARVGTALQKLTPASGNR